jgi:MFS family permease
MLRALRQRLFARLWAGQTISRIGDSLYEIALAWWVLQKTGSAEAMGAVLIFAFTPMLFFLLLGGVAVDRWPRVRVMMASDLLRGAIVCGVAALAYADRLAVGHIYIASLIFGFVDAFFQPASTAIVPDLVPVGDLTSANSLTSVGVQAGRILGPSLGAAIISLGGTSLAFAINGVSFFVSAALLWPLLRQKLAPIRREAAARSSVLRDLREGLATVVQTPWLWLTITFFAFTNVTLSGPFSVSLPFLVEQEWHAGVETLGLLYAVFPIGYILGGVYFGRKDRIRHRGRVAYIASMVAGLGLMAIGLRLPFALILIAALVNGAALEAFSVIWTSTLQELVPRDRLGRVSSIDQLGSFALLPIGFGIAGWATQHFGAATVVAAGGGITALFALIGVMHPAIRGLD